MNFLFNFRFIIKFVCAIFFQLKNNNYDYSISIPKNSRIIIYGYGVYGKKALVDLFFFNKLIDIYDKKLNNLPSILDNNSYDYIILSVMDSNSRVSILSYFKELNVPLNKIVYMYNLY